MFAGIITQDLRRTGEEKKKWKEKERRKRGQKEKA